MGSPRRRSLPILALVLALACRGDDGDDDTAAGTTAAASTSAGQTDSSGGGDSTTGFPMECEGLCAAAEVCVVPGECSADPPSCAPAEMVACDFGSGVCTLAGVCSGALYEGALLCEDCG